MNAKPHKSFASDERGSAMVETTIIMPAYIIVLFACMFFGNVLLGRAKQRSVTWYVGLKGGASEDELSAVFCQDVEGTFAIVGGSGVTGDDPYDAADIGVCFDDLAMKHQWRSLELVNGQMVPVDHEVDDYSSKFMEALMAERSQYEAAILSLVNEDTDGQPWLQRSAAAITYEFTADYLNFFLGQKGKQLTTGEYLSLETPTTDVELPTWYNAFSMVIRGTGAREGSQNIGSGGESISGEIMLGRTLDFLSDAGFSISAQARSQVRTFEDVGKISPFWEPADGPPE